MNELLSAVNEVRTELAAASSEVLFETCRLIVDEDEYEDVSCRLGGGRNNMDGAPYRIKFAWNSPAIIGATAIIDAIPGRSQLTLQLVAPVDSSTGVWQEWQATAGPGFGRVDVGL